MNKSLIAHGLKAIPYVFYSLLILFLVLYIKHIDFTQFQSVHFVWQFVVIGSLLGLGMRFWQIFIWMTLLKNLGAKDLRKSIVQLAYVYAKSWLGRYIPGTAPWILGKIYFASKHGISKSKLAVSSLLEGGLQIAVVMIVAFVLLIFDPRLSVINGTIKLLMVGVLAACIVAIFPPVFNRLISLAHRLLRKKKISPDDLASNKTIVQGALLYIVGALLSGTALFFIAKAVYPALGYNNLLFVVGVSNLAGALGMLAIFAPSGIGVREGILLTLLSLVMPPEYALIVTVTSRLWDVGLDLLFFAITKLAASLCSVKS
ncbi:MAG: lysylphosphatidylglycerol synthase domain-containing protein [Candidatus Saccharimonadales bacterium]